MIKIKFLIITIALILHKCDDCNGKQLLGALKWNSKTEVFDFSTLSDNFSTVKMEVIACSVTKNSYIFNGNMFTYETLKDSELLLKDNTFFLLVDKNRKILDTLGFARRDGKFELVIDRKELKDNFLVYKFENDSLATMIDFNR